MHIEKRFDPRYPVKEPVELAWTGPGGRASDLCLLRDLSFGGARLEGTLTVPRHAMVSITVRGSTLRGMVQYCKPAGPKHVIGIELDPESRGVVRARALNS